jgi:hypothetical protein
MLSHFAKVPRHSRHFFASHNIAPILVLPLPRSRCQSQDPRFRVPSSPVLHPVASRKFTSIGKYLLQESPDEPTSGTSSRKLRYPILVRDREQDCNNPYSTYKLPQPLNFLPSYQSSTKIRGRSVLFGSTPREPRFFSCLGFCFSRKRWSELWLA